MAHVAPALAERQQPTTAVEFHATRALRWSAGAPAARSSFRARKRALPSLASDARSGRRAEARCGRMALLLSAPSDSARRRAVRHLAPARLAVRIALVSAGADWRVIVLLALLLLVALVLLPSATADRPMRRKRAKGHRAETQVRLEHFMCLPDGKHKWLLSRDFQADARTRTGDPFITRERQVRDARPLAGRAATFSPEIGLFHGPRSGRPCPLVRGLTYPFCTHGDSATGCIRDCHSITSRRSLRLAQRPAPA